jgi:hypothetical protein
VGRARIVEECGYAAWIFERGGFAFEGASDAFLHASLGEGLYEASHAQALGPRVGEGKIVKSGCLLNVTCCESIV